ncbi:M48 family metallopeptidase [Actinopolyspora mortivallis]|uniref:Uncharacterized protein n=1 Tax=Actinopolyspora mortivallis TaxID=33906 RepID=A0A2T0GWU3_ACTMO|nr:M48 family metallopeptidase [Actinopolyspora mortivallis]PRW63564.1 hypothetical protein CEP50_09590 [Actinopolyspora mortivallis]
MRAPWRAVATSALHIGFLAAPAVLVLGLFGIAAYTARHDLGNGVRAAAAGLLVAAVTGALLWGLLRVPNRPRGVAVNRQGQPQLWRTVRRVCEAAETTDPDELRITAEPGVRLRERAGLLGLTRGTRCLEVGLPLIAGLNVSELSVVLAQELSRFGGGPVEVLASRVRECVLHTRRELTAGPTKWLFAGYAAVCRRLSDPLARSGVLRGDAVAVRLAGRRVTAATLRKHVGLRLGWEDYTREYLSMASRVERTPDVLLGFRSFLENQHRRTQLAERAKETIAAEEAADAARPTVSQRLQALRRASGESEETDERPALALVREPRTNVPAVENRLLSEGLGERVPWPELARMAADHDVAVKTARLSAAVSQSGVETEPTLAGVLAALHRGEGRELINPALNPGLAPELVDEAVVDTLTELLGAAVVDALVRAGRAQHELDWGGPPVVRLPDGRTLDPDKLVRPAVADPRLVPGLHRHLVHLGVPLEHSQPAEEEPEPGTSGVVSPVRVAGGLHDMVVTDRGVLLLPSSVRTLRRVFAGALASLRRSEHERLERVAATPVAELRESPGAQWVDTRDVAGAELHETQGSWELTLRLYLDEYAVSELSEGVTETVSEETEEELAALRVRGVGDALEQGTPYTGLGDLLGARLHTTPAEHSSE